MNSAVSEVPGAGVRSKGHLLRILGVGFGVAVIVGNTIGSGILLTPGYVAAQLRNPWLVFAVWVAGGVFAFFCTLSVVELGTMLPQAGGWFVYSRRAFGEYGGFLVGCCDWMMESAGIAYLTAAFAEFVADFVPGFNGHEKVLAIGCMLALMLLNMMGLRAGSRAQEITSSIKAVALLLFVAMCFVMSPSAAPVQEQSSHNLLQLTPLAALLAIVAALQPVIVTYDGWYGAIYFTEEDRDPARNLPRASIVGVIVCGAIFLLVNAALLHVFSTDGLAASSIPVADAAGMMLGNHGRSAILLLSMVTVVSGANSSMMMSPRVLFAMAREGLMPEALTSVTTGGTPAWALLLCTLVSIGLVLSGGFKTLIAVSAILFVVVYLSGFVSLAVLRRNEPNLARPFRMWGYPWTNLAICIGTGAFLVAAIIADLKHAAFTLALIVLTYPLYRWVCWIKRSRGEDAAAVVLAAEGGE